MRALGRVREEAGSKMRKVSRGEKMETPFRKESGVWVLGLEVMTLLAMSKSPITVPGF